MTRSIFYVNNSTIANACVEFARELGLTVTSDISDMSEDNYLTVGSKNYDINWIKNENYAAKKADLANIDILDLTDNIADFIGDCITIYNSNNEVADDVSLEDNLSPDRDIIIALFNKVKSQKKAPINYYVSWKNDQWVATTTEDGSYGNLSALYLNN